MLKQDLADIVSAARPQGWIMEPAAKQLLSRSGLSVPRHLWAKDKPSATAFAARTGYPLVAKVVSPHIIHKSEHGGVTTGIKDADELASAFDRFAALKGFAGMLVEESLAGLELIVGAKVDYQFGPVILLGIGGTAVEIYRDTALRMAPLTSADVEEMIQSLKAQPLLAGYRGAAPINLPALRRTMLRFSELVMAMGDGIESIDLNPVFCTAEDCIIADARIML